ncbi:MAG: hypothetical protein ACI4WS_08530 [Oscillospiraceae bacterium]
MRELGFTAKQNELMRLFKQDRLKRLNILQGSVRSGKTWISLILWAFWVASRPKDHLYMMCAKSLQTLKRNCLFPLQELIGEKHFTFSLSTKEGVLFGRKIMLEGANDARSEGKIRGITLGGASSIASPPCFKPLKRLFNLSKMFIFRSSSRFAPGTSGAKHPIFL